jgi:hypothetical protein
MVFDQILGNNFSTKKYNNTNNNTNALNTMTSNTINNNNKMKTINGNGLISKSLLNQQKFTNGIKEGVNMTNGGSGGGGGVGGANGESTDSNSSLNNEKILSKEDKKINLNALKNQDPFATNILDTVLRVVVYKFLSKKNEWKRLEVEGSLFVFER